MTTSIRVKLLNGLDSIFEKFNIQAQDAKSDAISKRVFQLFHMHKSKIIAFAIATLPLFPILWPIGYAVLRNSAKTEVDVKLAKQRMSKLSHIKSMDPTPLTETLKTGQPRPVIEDLLRYFKKSQIPLILYSLSDTTVTNSGNPRKEWKDLKKRFGVKFQEIERKRELVKQKLGITDAELNTRVSKKITQSPSLEIILHILDDLLKSK